MFNHPSRRTALQSLVCAALLTGMVYAMGTGGSSNPPASTDQAQGAVSLAALSPKAGAPGIKVTIKGSHFTGVTKVMFAPEREAVFTVVSDTEIEATVPFGAVTGPIQVYTSGGVVTSGDSFTVETE